MEIAGDVCLTDNILGDFSKPALDHVDGGVTGLGESGLDGPGLEEPGDEGGDGREPLHIGLLPRSKFSDPR